MVDGKESMDRPIHHRRKGFSLVLSLTVMSLLVLIILSLAGFLSIESRVAATQAELRKARMNALASARLALGTLQRLAGPDQRVTAKADLFESAPVSAAVPYGSGSTGNTYAALTAGASAVNGASVNPRRRNWAGVWSTGGSDTSKPRDWNPANPTPRAFLGWLVSPLAVNPSQPDLADPAATAQLVGDRGLGAGTDARNRGLPLITGTGAASIIANLPSGLSTVTLLGPGTLAYPGRPDYDLTPTATVNVDPDAVALPSMPLPGPLPADATSTLVIGRYAWWIGDEGVKARPNLADPSTLTANRREFAGTTDWRRAFRAQTNRHNPELTGNSAVRLLPDFATWWESEVGAGAWTESLLARTANGGSFRGWAQLRGGDAADSQALALTARHHHDFSMASANVLSDTLNGGLRRDLSMAFELPFEEYRLLTEFHDSPGEAGDINGESNPTSGNTWPRNLGFNLAKVMGINEGNTPGYKEWGLAGRKLGFVYEVPIPSATYAGRTAREGNPNLLGVPAVIRGPTWDLLRNYHRVYKREFDRSGHRGMPVPAADAYAARGSEPFTYAIGTDPGVGRSTPSSPSQPAFYALRANAAAMSRIINNGGDVPLVAMPNNTMSYAGWTSRLYAGPIPQPTAMKIAPSVVRIGLLFNPVWTGSRIGVAMDPRVTLHNPYNVPIEFIGVGMTAVKVHKLMFYFYRSDNGQPVNGNPDLSRIDLQTQYDGGRAITFRIFNNGGTLQPPPTGEGGVIRLEPGELRTFCASVTTTAETGEQVFDDNASGGYGQLRRIPGVFDYGNAGQSLVYYIAQYPNSSGWASSSIRIKAGMGFNPHTGAAFADNQNGSIDFHLFFTRFDNGNAIPNTATRTWVGGPFSANEGAGQRNVPEQDSADEHLLHRLRFHPRGMPTAQCLAQSADVPMNSPVSMPFAMMDLRARSWGDSGLANQRADTASALFVNHRAQLLDFRRTDGHSHTAAGWALEFTQTNALVTNFEISGARNNSFWGRSHTSAGGGQTRVILHQLPTRPLLSLAGLASIDSTLIDSQPGLTVGHAICPPTLTRSDRLLEWPFNDRPAVATGPANATPAARDVRYDGAWAANHALWDRYFFSGANAAEASSYGPVPKAHPDQAASLNEIFAALQAGQRPLDNPRIRWLIRGDTTEADFRNPATTAKAMLLEGGFNVNSASREAWKAVLAGMRGQAIPGGGPGENDRTPFSRLDRAGDAPSASNPSTRLRALTDAELERLADAVVRQVRLRGPFMSLSDFINRRLVQSTGGDITGLKGALQAAIDDADLNDASPINATFTTDTNRHPLGRALSADNSSSTAQAALGATSHLLQADVLNAIGHTLSARSDTFVIRAYGEAVSPDGRPTTGAWIELTVQRFPDTVAGGDLEPNERAADYRSLHDLASDQAFDERFRARTWSSLDAREKTNRTFGRKFRVVGVRWLAPNEI